MLGDIEKRLLIYLVQRFFRAHSFGQFVSAREGFERRARVASWSSVGFVMAIG